MNRLSLGYLSLVVAAFMIGLGNIWKFPALLLQYGLGALLVYLLFVALIVGLIAVALESTKHKRYEVLEYYLKEYGKPAFALMFLAFNLLLISYYSIVGGWTISALFITNVTSSVPGNIVTLVVVFAILTLILIRGKEKTFDVMVISVGLFFLAVIVTMIGMYANVPDKEAIGHFIGQAFSWRGITGAMVKDMAIQAAYSLSLGMGFYLILGEFLPENISAETIAIAGAVLDTVASILATFVIAMVLAVDPNVPIQGTALLFEGLPHVLLNVLNLPVLLYLLSFAVFLAAISSMIPIGETIVRIYSELSRLRREKAVPVVMGVAALLGLINVITMNSGIDMIGVLDGAVSTFVLFGGIIAAWAVVVKRDYIPHNLMLWGRVGVLIVGALGVYSLYHMLRNGQYLSFALLVGIVGVAVLTNDTVKRKVESVG